MLVNGVHGDQRELIVARCSRSFRRRGSRLCLQNGNTRIGDLAAKVFALQRRNGSLHALVAHNIGVLRHGCKNVAVLNQTEDRIRLIKAYADNVRVCSLDRVASAVGGAFVAAEDADHALRDVVFSDGLGLCGVTLAVLRLEQFKIGALEGFAEACFASNRGSGSCVDVHDTDLAGGNALCAQRVKHGLARGLAGGGVISGEGRFCRNVCRRVDIDDLDACIGSFLQRRGNGVGAVGGDDDRVAAARDGVIDLLDLERVILGVRSHERQRDAEFGSGLFSALFQGDPVLVNGVHGNECDFVALAGRGGLGGFFSAACAACQQAYDHGHAEQNGYELFHCNSS